MSDRELYTKNDSSERLQYASSDLWFCLLPALYLLVPGSKLLQTAFEGLVSALDGNEDDGLEVGQLDSLAASLLIVALGQVIGLPSTLGLHVFVVVFSFLGPSSRGGNEHESV